MAALETLIQHLPVLSVYRHYGRLLKYKGGNCSVFPPWGKTDSQSTPAVRHSKRDGGGGTRVFRKHRGEESPNSKALSREGDIRAVLRPDRHQPGKQDGREKWWTVHWESSLKTVIHPENSMDGWNSGLCEEIQLQKTAGATPWWAWHAKLKKCNFSWSKGEALESY